MEARPWHREYDPGVAPSLQYPEATLDEVLRATASRYPQSPALYFFGRKITYRNLDRLVDRLARGLGELGLRPGDRVAVFMPNCPQQVMALYALWRAGAVAVPVNPLYTTHEFERQVGDSGASMAIVLDLFYPRVRPAMGRTGLRRVVVTSIKEYLPSLLRLLFTMVRGGREGHHVFLPDDDTTVTLSQVFRLGSDEGFPSASAPSDPAALMYTGGTTGIPKGAVLTHRNLVTNAAQVGAWATGLDEGSEVMMSALPLAHCYAMTVCMNLSVLKGWAQVILPDPRDLQRLLRAVRRHRVTVLPGVPTLYAAINNHPGVKSGRFDLHSIEVCISGAAGLPAEVQSEFERLTGGRLVEGFGLTEASPVTHANPLATAGHVGSIGLPLPDTDCKLVDADSETTAPPPGQPGVLCISGPQVMSGYWNRPEETRSTLRQDEQGRMWLHTGDVAEMSEDGYFRIIDRKKDMILASGGLNVYPREIEDALFEHPRIMHAAVIGVPVGRLDQRAKAFVVLREGQQASEEEILAFLRERLAPYKVPKSVEFRSELPLAFTGKVLRRVLSEEELAAADQVSPQGNTSID